MLNGVRFSIAFAFALAFAVPSVARAASAPLHHRLVIESRPALARTFAPRQALETPRTLQPTLRAAKPPDPSVPTNYNPLIRRRVAMCCTTVDDLAH
jgi:hypothetical protein